MKKEEDLNVVSFSGGKDSTAMLIRMLELDYEIDEIVFADTYYEFPIMYEYIDKVEDYIKENFDESLKITIIGTHKNYEDEMFGKITKGPRKGEVRGFPLTSFGCYWSRDAKQRTLKRYMGKRKRFIGIAYDEKKRRIKNYKEENICYPLIDWKWTEQDCIDYLKDKGLHNPLYDQFDRLGCWWCPKQSLKSINVLINEYPEYWEKIKEWEKKLQSYNKERVWKHGYDTKELEKRFKKA